MKSLSLALTVLVRFIDGELTGSGIDVGLKVALGVGAGVGAGAGADAGTDGGVGAGVGAGLYIVTGVPPWVLTLMSTPCRLSPVNTPLLVKSLSLALIVFSTFTDAPGTISGTCIGSGSIFIGEGGGVGAGSG